VRDNQNERTDVEDAGGWWRLWHMNTTTRCSRCGCCC